MEQHMKARKEYPCDHCGQIIKKGELYNFGKGLDFAVGEFNFLNNNLT